MGLGLLWVHCICERLVSFVCKKKYSRTLTELPAVKTCLSENAKRTKMSEGNKKKTKQNVCSLEDMVSVVFFCLYLFNHFYTLLSDCFFFFFFFFFKKGIQALLTLGSQALQIYFRMARYVHSGIKPLKAFFVGIQSCIWPAVQNPYLLICRAHMCARAHSHTHTHTHHPIMHHDFFFLNFLGHLDTCYAVNKTINSQNIAPQTQISNQIIIFLFSFVHFFLSLKCLTD